MRSPLKASAAAWLFMSIAYLSNPAFQRSADSSESWLSSKANLGYLAVSAPSPQSTVFFRTRGMQLECRRRHKVRSLDDVLTSKAVPQIQKGPHSIKPILRAWESDLDFCLQLDKTSAQVFGDHLAN